jgi:hypothetical protein
MREIDDHRITSESTSAWSRRMDREFQLHCMVGRLEGLMEGMKMRLEDQQRQIERQGQRIDELMTQIVSRRR